MIKTEFDKAVMFFKERDSYRVQLTGMIKKYGIAGLPENVQRTIPTDMKVLYEMKWYLNIVVWIRTVQIAFLNARNEGIKKAVNG